MRWGLLGPNLRYEMGASDDFVALRLRLLGPVQLVAGGRTVAPDTRKATALLAYIAMAGPITRDAAAALLYPDSPSERARGALRRTLSSLRDVAGPDIVETQGDLLSLRKGAIQLDVDETKEILDSISDHGHTPHDACERCIAPLTDLVEFHRGDFMEGFALRDSPPFDDWQRREAEAARRARGEALARLTAAHSSTGDTAGALRRAREWLGLDPLNEAAHRAVMIALFEAGDRSGALQAYRRCTALLDVELGVPPLPSTTEVYEAIRSGSPPRATEVRTRSTVPRTSGKKRAPFVGRSTEKDRLRDSLRRARSRMQIAAIEGEPGIGKTMLAELIAREAAEEATVVRTRCYPDEHGIAFASVTRALRSLPADRLPNFEERARSELSRLMPDLGSTDAPSQDGLDDPSARARFMEALSDALLGAGDTLLLMDDVHWADDASMDVLTHLARQRDRSIGMLLLTWRTEEVPTGHRLRRLVSEASDDGLILILDRFSHDDIAELARAMGNAESSSVEQLSDASEGLPLIVGSLLSDMGSAAETKGVPGDARAMFRSRVAALSASTQQMLTAASVIGRSFTLDLVRDASGRNPEETVAALEELLARGLVDERPTGSDVLYDFNHEMLRSVVYEDASLARKRLLHARIARALDKGSTHTDDASIALHLERSGQTGEAAERYARAAEKAVGLNGLQTALVHLDNALALGHPDPAWVHERSGDVHTLLGNYAGAIVAYEAAAALGGGARTARIEHRIGAVYERDGNHDVAIEYMTSALAALDAADPLRGHIEADLGLVEHRRGDPAAAVRWATAARSSAMATDDALATARALNVLGIVTAASGGTDEALSHLHESAELAERAGDAPAQVAAFNNLALIHRGRGEPEVALDLGRRAIELCRASGDRHREAALHSNLADLLHELGQGDEAIEELKLSATLFAEVAGEGAPRPGIWKLVEW